MLTISMYLKKETTTQATNNKIIVINYSLA